MSDIKIGDRVKVVNYVEHVNGRIGLVETIKSGLAYIKPDSGSSFAVPEGNLQVIGKRPEVKETPELEAKSVPESAYSEPTAHYSPPQDRPQRR